MNETQDVVLSAIQSARGRLEMEAAAAVRHKSKIAEEYQRAVDRHLALERAITALAGAASAIEEEVLA